MTLTLPSDFEDLLVPAARAAGEAILEVYGREDLGVVTKPDGTPVTAADHASHAVLARLLPELLAVPIISEEAPVPPAEVRQAWRTFWCVDPLDGTKEFVKRSGQFTVNIGLIHDGAPVAGAVHSPVQGFTYVGHEGGVGQRRERDGRTSALRVTPHNAGPPLRVVARSKESIAREVERFLAKLPPYERVASWSVLEMIAVAEGLADVQLGFRLSHEWDTAAAHAVLSAAGGSVVTLDSKPLRYNKEALRNPRFVAMGGFDVTPFLGQR